MWVGNFKEGGNQRADTNQHVFLLKMLIEIKQQGQAPGGTAINTEPGFNNY